MATDAYGVTIRVGDKVTKVGVSSEFIVSRIFKTAGEELLELDGIYKESRVKPCNVIKKWENNY